MKPRELQNLGVPSGVPMRAATDALRAAAQAGWSTQDMRERVRAVVASARTFLDDATFAPLARALLEDEAASEGLVRRGPAAPFRMWGRAGEDFEQESIDQIRRACTLPVSVAGALMPDAHVGYGLPIGGVLATEGAVIPYAVGVDIACRMKLTVLDIPPSELDHERGRDRLTRAIEAETRFGIGAAFGARGAGRSAQSPREHNVMDEDWSVSPVTQRLKDKARAQLGTSGSGNHFVEFGTLTIEPDGPRDALGLEPGTYLALLSHSGSRGAGAAVCDHYSRIAIDKRAGLAKDLKHLAWLSLDEPEGREYWEAMELMGKYAAANHACIHRHVAKNLGAHVIAGVENHHNFAWKEMHDFGDGRGPREVVVHRKGATPAGQGVLGVIPGSMASPGFVVRGLDGADSLASASHGAGRVMSRTAAKNKFRWSHVRDLLRDHGVTLISAGIDENPLVYKDIRHIMARQRDLVEPIARFDPRLVKMAPEGERAED